MAKYRLGVIGAGNMAEAIVRGILQANLLKTTELIAADTTPARQDLFNQELGVTCRENFADFSNQCETLLLAVKPQVMQAVMETLAGQIPDQQRIISIAAGVRCQRIEQVLGHQARVVRVMPNTPMLVGAGMSAVCGGTLATQADVDAVLKIFAAGGLAMQVTEAQMDAVTAVSGSGPAYVFYLVEVLAQAGTAVGLSPEAAAKLARQTIVGAGQLLASSPLPPEQLRKNVTSPGGTTQAAIEEMQAHNLAGVICMGVEAAARRSAELSR
ncbi:MAG: pyrroline-5-carboxylate reductase [Phycisphaerae bacterium]